MIDPFLLGLNIYKVVGDEARCVCPFHNDHKPSATFNIVIGVFHCFACGITAKAETVARELGGFIVEVDSTKLRGLGWGSEKEWLWVKTSDKAIGNTYLHGRGLSDAQIDSYDIRQFSDGVIFLIKNRDGIIVGSQIRFYSGKIRYTILGERTPIWPMNKLIEFDGPIVLVEGIFGAIRGRSFGINAVATIGAHSAVQSTLALASFRKIMVLDNDEAGHINTAKALALGVGLRAVAPGAEMDNKAGDYWKAVASGTSVRHIFNHNQFLREAGASQVTQELFKKALKRKEDKRYGITRENRVR